MKTTKTNKITDYCPVCNSELLKLKRNDCISFQCIFSFRHYKYDFDPKDNKIFSEAYWIDDYKILNNNAVSVIYRRGEIIFSQQQKLIPIFNKEDLLNFLILQ